MATIFAFVAIGNGCVEQDPYSEKDFVGKWESSKVTTPVYLHEDGVWELQTDSGEVQQYGIWGYSNRKLLWTVRVGGVIRHDPNPVLSVSANEFKLREKDGRVTTFRRL